MVVVIAAKTFGAEPWAFSPAAPTLSLQEAGPIRRTRWIGGFIDNGMELRRLPSGMQDQRDEELLVLVGNGDRQAYRILVERHGRRVLGMARRMTGNLAEAEDVAQEAFLRVWQRAAEW